MKTQEQFDRYIAHVRKKDDGIWDDPHLLSAHVAETAKRAQGFAAKFSSAEWGKAIGLLHDAGKGRPEWQAYLGRKSGYDEEAHLEGKKGKIPHAIHGAKLAEEVLGKGFGRVLAYCIAGHHAGLPDGSSAEGAGQSALLYQLDHFQQTKDVAPYFTDQIKNQAPKKLPRKFASNTDLSLWIRMLYSCLADADFLDTEAYMQQDQAAERGGYCSIQELLERYRRFAETMDKNAQDTRVNQIRRAVRDQCVKAAGQGQGMFSLSVPTGGGKTLSSLAFALEHASMNHLDRVIYVIPYTSIIEQNANVFRSVLGADQVVEHHSSLDEDSVTAASRLAAENWDAPVIVTTSVQFFESLFAAKASRCRKLHNIVKSVVVLDEAQLMPVDFLSPIIETIQLLADHYQVSFVLSTATQPSFREQIVGDTAFKGLRQITEIMGSRSEVQSLYDSLKRVTVDVPAELHTPSDWEEIAHKLKQHEQVLCIVSDRKSCRELHNLMPPGTYHLSALMCGYHRSQVIEIIKQKLARQEPVRVISTQLVEAGVDMDFPVVYRAMAGLDSIAQAAGRCNREGRLAEGGRVIVFTPPRKAPVGLLRKAAATTCSILAAKPADVLDYPLFEQFFREWYWKANSLDTQDILRLLQCDPSDLSIYFRTAAERFRMIDDALQRPVIVRYGESPQLIERLRYMGPNKTLMRKLQRYTVSVYQHDVNVMLNRGSLEEVHPGIFALTSEIEYRKDIGLIIEPILYNPEDLIQ